MPQFGCDQGVGNQGLPRNRKLAGAKPLKMLSHSRNSFLEMLTHMPGLHRQGVSQIRWASIRIFVKPADIWVPSLPMRAAAVHGDANGFRDIELGVACAGIIF